MARFEKVRPNRKAMLAVLLALALAPGGLRAFADEMSLDEQTYKIREGVTLHEQGNFEGALAKYREVLAVNPKNATALYETSFTLAAQKKWQPCYEAAEKALRLESPFRPQIYVTAGSCYDAAGDSKKAISLFKSGLRETPEDPGLWFNLGVVYLRTGNESEAISALERTIEAKPEHLSANFALGELYAKNGQRIPALLASLRSLSLDPESERASTSAQTVKRLLWQGVSSEAPDKVTVNVPSDVGEGPFAGEEMMLSLLAASRYLPENKDKSELQWVVEMLDSLFGFMAESAGERKGKCVSCDRFGTFFSEMKAKALVEPFVYVALASLDRVAAAEWQRANLKKVAELKAWLGERTVRLQSIG